MIKLTTNIVINEGRNRKVPDPPREREPMDFFASWPMLLNATKNAMHLHQLADGQIEHSSTAVS
jgi:hypothetical protein